MGQSVPRRQISSDPIINTVHRRLELILALASTLFIVYATLVPLAGALGDSQVRALGNDTISRQDVAQNIVLYVPFGLFLCLALRPKPQRWVLAGVGSMGVAALLSVSAECMQSVLPGRVSSSVDVMCNLGGTAIGVLIAVLVRRGAHTYGYGWRDRIRHQPIFLAFAYGTAMYVSLSLVPFPLQASPGVQITAGPQLRLASGAAQAEVHAEHAGSDYRARYDRLLDVASTFLGFGLLGFMAGCSLKREFQFRWLAAGLLVLWTVFCVLGLVTLAQAFLTRGDVNGLLLPAGLGGALLGVVASQTPHDPAKSASALLSWVAAAVVLTLITTRELNPFQFDFSVGALQHQLSPAAFVPFRKYFSNHSLLASGDVLAKCGRFLVLGLLLSLALRRSGISALSARLRVGLWIVGLFCVGIEIVQLGCPSRSVDVTHVLLGMTACGCGLIAMQWWLDVIKTYRAKRPCPAGTHRLDPLPL